jgi:hypothetical protein
VWAQTFFTGDFGMTNLSFRSEALAWVASSTRNLPLDFLPDRGPNGGRLCLDCIHIRASLSLTTTSTGSIQGENQASFIKRLRIRDADGELVNLSGMKLRLNQIEEYGMNGPVDGVDLSTGTTATKNFDFIVPFYLPRARRGWDTALPVSHLKNAGGAGQGGAVEIDMPAYTDLNGSGSSVTINSGDYTFWFVCREEFDNEVKTRFEQRMITTAANNDHYLPVNGGLLRKCTYHGDGANEDGGGDNVAEVTAVNVDALRLSNMAPYHLLNDFIIKAWNGQRERATFPFIQADAAALPIVYPKHEEKIPQMYRINGQLYIRTAGATTTRDFLFHVLTPRTGRSTAAERARAGGAATVSMKTDGKSRRNPKNWDAALRPILPAKLG